MREFESILSQGRRWCTYIERLSQATEHFPPNHQQLLNTLATLVATLLKFAHFHSPTPPALYLSDLDINGVSLVPDTPRMAAPTPDQPHWATYGALLAMLEGLTSRLAHHEELLREFARDRAQFGSTVDMPTPHHDHSSSSGNVSDSTSSGDTANGGSTIGDAHSSTGEMDNDHTSNDAILIPGPSIHPHQALPHIHPAIYDMAMKGNLSMVHLSSLLPTEVLLACGLPDSLRHSPDLNARPNAINAVMMPPSLEPFMDAWFIFSTLYVYNSSNAWGSASLRALTTCSTFVSRAADRYTWPSIMRFLLEVVNKELMERSPSHFARFLEDLSNSDPHPILEPRLVEKRLRQSNDESHIICQAYQDGACSFRRCRHRHECEICQRDHAAMDCPNGDRSNAGTSSKRSRFV